MNIFATHILPANCAVELCDVHLRKLICETAQLLSTAHRILDGDAYADEHSLYKATHVNHPCAKWVRETSGNYNWLVSFLAYALMEYEFRFDKQHKCHDIIDALMKAPESIPFGRRQMFVQCMPDEFKQDLPIPAYQAYIRAKRKEWATRMDKRRMYMTWTKRDEPLWMKGWEE